MKKVISIILMICLFFSINISGFAETKSISNPTENDISLEKLRKEAKNIETHNYDNVTVEIIELSDSDQNSGEFMPHSSYTTPGKTLLVITSNYMSRQFIMTKHALERLEERFAGNYYTIVKALTEGKIYFDNKYGGYIAYYKGVVVSLSDDLETIKTVIDNVSLATKIKNALWTFFKSAVDLLWS